MSQLKIKEDYGKYDEDVFKEPHQVLMQECLLIEKNVGEVVDKSTKKLRKKKRGRRKLVYEVNLEKFFTYKWVNEYMLINNPLNRDNLINWDEDDGKDDNTPRNKDGGWRGALTASWTKLLLELPGDLNLF